MQNAFARNYFQLFGKGVIDFSNKVQIKPEQSSIRVSLELNPDDVDLIAKDTETALKSGGGLPPEMLEQLSGATTAPTTQPQSAASQPAE